MPYRVDSPTPLRELPGEAVPYSLADGEGRAHLLLGQVGRALAGAEETGNAMSVMTALGPADRPIPMHYHEKEHDFFLCVRGRIQVWADGASRILGPGDIASVPAGVVHAYQFHSHYSQFMGPIAPASARPTWPRSRCARPSPSVNEYGTVSPGSSRSGVGLSTRYGIVSPSKGPG